MDLIVPSRHRPRRLLDSRPDTRYPAPTWIPIQPLRQQQPRRPTEHTKHKRFHPSHRLLLLLLQRLWLSDSKFSNINRYNKFKFPRHHKLGSSMPITNSININNINSCNINSCNINNCNINNQTRQMRPWLYNPKRILVSFICSQKGMEFRF